MARFESFRMKTHGAMLDVRRYAGRGDPIVLLHGGPGMGNYFDSFPEVLSPPYQVVSYDQRGCGKSTSGGSFEIEAQVEDLEAIRTHLGTDRIHLFGHSWGGMLAQLYAKAYPQRVASMVLCCSMSSTGRTVAALESKCIAQRVMSKPKRSRVGWVVAGTLMQLPGRVGDLGFGLVMRQLMPNYVVRRQLPPRYDARHASKRAWRGTNRSLKAVPEHYLERPLLDAPVMIVQGRQDVIRETNAVLVSRYAGASNIWIDDAAHFPWFEQPDVFAKRVLDFYRSAMSPRSRSGESA